jgi:type I restriction enzyme S subunit
VRHLSTGDLEKIEIPFLELGDQKRAAEILDLADEAIVKTEVLIAKLKAIKQGLLHDLLTRGLDDNGELRDPEKHPDSFADTPLGRYPANWDLAPFAKYVADWAVGPRFSGKFYASDGNIATLRTTDMDDEGNLCLSTMPLARLNVDAFRTHLLRPGDLVISRSGTCGIASVFSGHDCPVLPGAFLLRFRLNDGMSPDFARLYFNSPMGRTRVVWEAEGGVQKNIRGTSVLPIVMVVPTLAEQKEIVARVGSLSHHLSAEDAYLSKLKAIKKGLMQDLLNGRVRVAATRRERPAIGSQERSRRVL